MVYGRIKLSNIEITFYALPCYRTRVILCRFRYLELSGYFDLKYCVKILGTRKNSLFIILHIYLEFMCVPLELRYF